MIVSSYFKNNILILLLSTGLILASCWLQINLGINFADEGFLWYGSWQIGMGSIPMLDFQAYDPGRYLWNALWMPVFGGGLLGLRKSVLLFQIIGLFCGILTLRRCLRTWPSLIIAAILLLVWMHPRHKIFEHTITLVSIYFAVRLLDAPTRRNHFIAGLFVGLSAFFGRNHGVYGLISYLALMGFIYYKYDSKDFLVKISIWGFGILIGYSPMLIMFVFIPGFFESTIQNILFIIYLKSTNISLPIPWPWKINFSSSFLEIMKSFSIGFFFVAMPVYYGLTSIWILRKQRFPKTSALNIVIASFFVGLCYMHYAFSRADLNHLAQGMGPFLMGIFGMIAIIPNKNVGRFCLFLILICTYFSIIMLSPYYKKLTASQNYTNVNISDDILSVSHRDAQLINNMIKINQEIIPAEEQLLIVPHWPGFYPILQRKSPLWDIYLLFKETKKHQKEIIARLNKVKYIIYGDVATDGRDDLRFKNTHPLVWQYFKTSFSLLASPGLPPGYYLLKRN